MEDAAWGYAGGVLESATGKLGSFLYGEFRLWANVRRNIQFIKDELQSMDAFMQDVLRSGPQNEQMKIWMIQVLEVACDSEECIDKFTATLGDRRGHKNNPPLAAKPIHALKNIVDRYFIAKDIEELKGRAKEVSERRSRYSATIKVKKSGITESGGAEETNSRLIRYNHLITENTLVGIGSEKQKKLFKLAFNRPEGDLSSVLWVIGPPGSGKTALAKMIYRRRNQPEHRISCSAWVTVSENFDSKRVLGDILRQIVKKGADVGTRDEQELLKNTLQEATSDDKRFLLILDCCKREHWDKIKNDLPPNSRGHIVVTTREEDQKKEKDNSFEHDFYKVEKLEWGQRSELVRKLLFEDSSLKESWFKWFWRIENLVMSFIFGVANILAPFLLMLISFCGGGSLIAWAGHRLIARVGSIIAWGGSLIASGSLLILILSLVWFPVNQLLVFLRDANLPIMHKRNIFWCIIVILFVQGALPYYAAMLAAKPLRMPVDYCKKYIINILITGNLLLLPFQVVSRGSIPLALKCLCAAVAGSSMDLNKLLWLPVLSIGSLTHLWDDQFIQVMNSCCKSMSKSSRECIKDLVNLPEGYVIERRRLIRRWIAQGLVGPSGGFSKGEEAQRCFDELVSWCVIEPESVSPSGQIKSCRVNAALMQVLIISDSSSKHGDNNQLASHGPTDQGGNGQAASPGLVDHVGQQQAACSSQTNPGANQEPPSNSPMNLGGNQHAPTSFQLFNARPSVAINQIQDSLSEQTCESLTIVDLEGCKGLGNNENFNKSLCTCTKLRFLSLRNTDITDLPKNIENLQYLETLVLRQTKIKKLDGIGKLEFLETLDIRQTQVATLPDDFVSLHRLKHFYAGNSDKPERESSGHDNDFSPSAAVEVPEGMCEMSALQTLAHVNSKKASKLLHAMPGLIQLRKLGIVLVKEKLNSRALCFSLMVSSASLRSLSICYEDEEGSLEFLEYLYFPHQQLESLNLKGSLRRLPPWIASHKQLKKLTLSLTLLRKEAIKLIGKIPSLLCFKLYTKSVKEKELSLGRGEFPALKMLVVHCNSIQAICFEEGASPRLEVLKWVLSLTSTGERTLQGVDNLRELKEILLIGQGSDELYQRVKTAIEDHSSYKASTLVLNKIDKASREINKETNGGNESHEAETSHKGIFNCFLPN